MMYVTTPGMFYFLRFLLGVFEAGFYPGIILYLTFWYPTERRAKAFGLFMSASALAGVIGGPLAGTMMTGLHGVSGWSGWQWVFLLEGIPSVIAGIVTLLYLTDKPEKAGHRLSAEDRRVIAEDLERDRQALGPREHNMFAALRDPRCGTSSPSISASSWRTPPSPSSARPSCARWASPARRRLAGSWR
jgi:MFS family permease